jgi:hypothetical protein
MDPRPDAIVRRELERLLAEMSKAKQPSNITLSRAVWQALRPMIDAEIAQKDLPPEFRIILDL